MVCPIPRMYSLASSADIASCLVLNASETRRSDAASHDRVQGLIHTQNSTERAMLSPVFLIDSISARGAALVR